LENLVCFAQGLQRQAETLKVLKRLGSQLFGGLANVANRTMHSEEQFQNQLHRPYCARHNAHTDCYRTPDKVMVDLYIVAGCLAPRLLGQ
jgi:hypothetical protein